MRNVLKSQAAMLTQYRWYRCPHNKKGTQVKCGFRPDGCGFETYIKGLYISEQHQLSGEAAECHGKQGAYDQRPCTTTCPLSREQHMHRKSFPIQTQLNVSNVKKDLKPNKMCQGFTSSLNIQEEIWLKEVILAGVKVQMLKTWRR